MPNRDEGSSSRPTTTDEELVQKLDELGKDIETFRTGFQQYGAKVRRALLEAEGGGNR